MYPVLTLTHQSSRLKIAGWRAPTKKNVFIVKEIIKQTLPNLSIECLIDILAATNIRLPSRPTSCATTLHGRRYDVKTLNWRRSDVLTSRAGWLLKRAYFIAFSIEIILFYWFQQHRSINRYPVFRLVIFQGAFRRMLQFILR